MRFRTSDLSLLAFEKSASHPLAPYLDGPVGKELPASGKGVNRFDPTKLKDALAKIKSPGQHSDFHLARNGDTRQEYPTKFAALRPDKLLRLKERRGELLDFDGTLIPNFKGNASEYRKQLSALTADDLSPLAKEMLEVGNPIDIVTARPAMFHKDIRDTATRLGLSIGEIHEGGFDKTLKVKELGRPLLDNNEDVVTKIHKNLGPEWATLVPTHEKAADSWLQRWAALHAARDASNMQAPTQDALAGKLGGPLSLGLGEAVSNLSMGDTRRERHENLTDAVEGVREKGYGETAMAGLRASLPYALIGAAGGVAHSALAPFQQTLKSGPHWNTSEAVRQGATGAGVGVSLAVLRPLLQKLILDNVSAKARRKAIAIKADMPMRTALPFGDALAAGLHKEAQTYEESTAALQKIPDTAWPAFVEKTKGLVDSHSFKRMGMKPGVLIQALLGSGVSGLKGLPPASGRQRLLTNIDASTYAGLQKSNPDFVKSLYAIATTP